MWSVFDCCFILILLKIRNDLFRSTCILKSSRNKLSVWTIDVRLIRWTIKTSVQLLFKCGHFLVFETDFKVDHFWQLLLFDRRRWSITVCVCLIVVRMSIFKSLDDRWAYLTIDRRPWSSRTIKWCYCTTVLSRTGCISCYYLFIIFLLLIPIYIWNDIIDPDKKLIICLESLKLRLCRFCACWCLILFLRLVLLNVFFLLREPLRLFFLVSLESVAFAKLFLFLSITARSREFPLLFKTIELVIFEIDRFDLLLVVIWIPDIE